MLQRDRVLFIPCFCPCKGELVHSPIPVQVRLNFNSKLWLLHIQNLHIYTYTCLCLHWLLFNIHITVCKAFAVLSLPLSLAKIDFLLNLCPAFSLSIIDQHCNSASHVSFPSLKTNINILFSSLLIVIYTSCPMQKSLFEQSCGNYCMEMFYTQPIWCSQPVAL